MAQGKNKTKPTDNDVLGFIDRLDSDQQRTDAHWIAALMERLSGEKPRMWGPTIIGFGSYHYKYASGREGDMCRIGFSPRKGQIVLYIIDGFASHETLMAQLGKYKTGKSCLYIKKLSDIDTNVVEQLCSASLEWMNMTYPSPQ